MFQKYIPHSFPPTLFYLVSFGYNFQPALLRAAWYLGLALLKSSDGCWFGAEPYWEDSISGTQSDVAILSALFHIWSYIGIELTEYSLVTYHFLIFVYIHIVVYQINWFILTSIWQFILTLTSDKVICIWAFWLVWDDQFPSSSSNISLQCQPDNPLFVLEIT